MPVPEHVSIPKIEIRARPAPVPSNSELEAGRVFFAEGAKFVMSVVDAAAIPPPDRPEVCFCGRSNVGKSSLINALTGQKKLARTSRTPGRTQQLNYFSIRDSLYLVDVPGYGYARMPKKIQRRGRQLLFNYLRGRAALRRVFLLLDARHAVTSTDQAFLDAMAESAVPMQFVLTKSDLTNRESTKRTQSRISQAIVDFPSLHMEVISTSSRRMAGIDMLRSTIASLK